MFKAFFDGSCEPVNPGGTAKFGIVIKKDGEIIHTECGMIGKGPLMTNNVAECVAVGKILDWFNSKELTDEPIQVYGDSMLIIQKVSGRWKKKAKGIYADHLLEVMQKVTRFKNISFQWIPREENFEADELSKMPIGG